MDAQPEVPDQPLWQRTLDAIGEAVIATDLDGSVTLWNAAAERLYGWTAEEALGANIVDLTPSAASRDQAAAILAHLSRGETWRGRFQVRRRDGTTFPALVTDAPLLDDDGRLIGIIGVSADLTEQLEAEASARRGELQIAVAHLARTALDVLSLDALLDRSVDVVAAMLPAPLVLVGEFARSGDRMAPRAGVGWHRDVIGGPAVPAHRSAPGTPPVVVQDYRHASAELQSPLLTDHSVRAGVTAQIAGRPGSFGTLGVYDTTPRSFGPDQIAFVESVAGVIGGAVVRSANEAQLRRLAEHLAGEQRRYRELFDLAPDPYLVTDLDGVIRRANRQAQVLLNIDRLEGTPLATFVASDDEAFRRRVRDAAASPSTGGWDLTLAPRNRPQLIARANVSRGASADGTPVLRWVLHDVTDARRSQRTLEDAFAQAREHVSHLRDVDEWKNVMLSAAAHDLRTPLSVIRLAATTTLEQPDLDPSDQRQLLEAIRSHAGRAQTLLHNLLDLDRLTRGVVSAEREPVRLDELVAEAVDATAIADHPITRDLEQLTASVDPGQLRAVTANLLGNAVQHTPALTPVNVVLRAEEGTAVLTVEDEGPGLPDDPGDIFAPFVTIARHDEDVTGTGIGLSIVKLFVDLHDGVVHAEDRSGGGTRVVVELPDCIIDDADTTGSAGGARNADARR